jgi:trimethylamine--corrinoid protein Co-methyltransferase
MPNYDFFTPTAGLEQIHQAALRILDEIGVEIDHVEMRERLTTLGCRVAGTHVTGDRVTFPPGLVAATLAAVPPSFQLFGRTPEITVLVGGGPMLCTNTGILANVYDLDTGSVRRATLADVAATTRILDALPNVDIVYVSLLDATDQPAHLITLADFAATLANTPKPLIGPGVIDRAEAEAIVAMTRALRGPELARYPACATTVSASTSSAGKRSGVIGQTNGTQTG